MKVRNHTLKNTEYKGRWTEARDEECPCRPCFSSHDCGFRTGGGKWVISVECLTRYNSGCPDPIPEPQHIFKKKNTCVRCLSCVRVEVKKEEKKTDDITFESVAEWKRRNKLVETWEDFDKERLRKIVVITAMERGLEKARENLSEWNEQVVAHLKATIGERDKQ